MIFKDDIEMQRLYSDGLCMVRHSSEMHPQDAMDRRKLMPVSQG
jgi:hypothetical protein